MRGMKGKNRHCRRCGAPFTVDGKTGGLCYCSAECREANAKERRRKAENVWYHKHKEEIRRKPREIKCKRCGQMFMGMSRQAYCPTCLNSGDRYMQQLRDNRSERFAQEA